jgi:hypothetical protein
MSRGAPARIDRTHSHRGLVSERAQQPLGPFYVPGLCRRPACISILVVVRNSILVFFFVEQIKKLASSAIEQLIAAEYLVDTTPMN